MDIEMYKVKVRRKLISCDKGDGELTSPIVTTDPRSARFSKEQARTNLLILILTVGPKAIELLHNSGRLCLEALSARIKRQRCRFPEATTSC